MFPIVLPSATARLGSESNDSRLSCQGASVLFCCISELNDGQTRDTPEMARIDRQHRVAVANEFRGCQRHRLDGVRWNRSSIR